MHPAEHYYLKWYKESIYFFPSVYEFTQVEKIYNSSGKIPTYITEITSGGKRERHTDSMMKIEGAEVC